MKMVAIAGLVIGAGVCSSCARDEQPAVDNRGEDSRGADITPEQLAGLPESADAARALQPYVKNGNIVPSGGRVLVNIGPMQNLWSRDPIKHVFDRGVVGVPGETIALRMSAWEQGGRGVTLEFAYVDEAGPRDMSQLAFAYLELTENIDLDLGPRQVALAGLVSVSLRPGGRAEIAFTDLELGSTNGDGQTFTSREYVGDASIVGDLERICTANGELDPMNPFCQGAP
jgi:hypothetical protein